MKIPPLVFLAALAAPLILRAQVSPTAISATPVATTSATARILGNLPDGTPPPPAPPKPVFVVPAGNIQETKIHDQGGRATPIFPSRTSRPTTKRMQKFQQTRITMSKFIH